MTESRKIAALSPAVIVSALIMLSFLSIAGHDAYCGGTMDIADRICSANSVGYVAFPQPVLYFLEDWIGSRPVQLAALFVVDLAIIAGLFSRPALRRHSIRTAIYALFVYAALSAVFFLLAIYIYFSM